MMVPPPSRTPSPQTPEENPNEKRPSFPIDWFFNRDASPPSERTIRSVKPRKPRQDPNHKPLELSSCVEYYQDILKKPKEKQESKESVNG